MMKTVYKLFMSSKESKRAIFQIRSMKLDTNLN